MVELWEKGSKCLVGRLRVAKKIYRDAFKALLLRIWRIEGRLYFNEIHDNLWLFEFSEESNKRRVLDGRPWTYDRTLLKGFRWENSSIADGFLSHAHLGPDS